MTVSGKPLVTFALFAYNQERFIREAVEGAFAQTYSPLEIILSDDHSTDRTFEIMEEMAGNYNGPHTVILNRNERNLGIGGHVNRIMEISSGELIVGAAGDDVSFPERTTRLYEKWLTSKPPAMYLYSDAEIIDSLGAVRGPLISPLPKKKPRLADDVRSEVGYTIGCAEAWDREVFAKFGPLNDDVVSEDRVISLRARLLGEIAYLPMALVRYRIHENNTFNSIRECTDYDAMIRKSQKICSIRLATFSQVIRDLSHPCVSSGMPQEELRAAIKVALSQKKILELKIQFMNSDFWERWGVVGRCFMKPYAPGIGFRLATRLLIPWMHRAVLARHNKSSLLDA